MYLFIYKESGKVCQTAKFDFKYFMANVQTLCVKLYFTLQY